MPSLLGEVVVSGIWTVYHEFDAEDEAWAGHAEMAKQR